MKSGVSGIPGRFQPRDGAEEAGTRRVTATVASVIQELQAAGTASLRAIAAGLNERSVPTCGGNGGWSAIPVMRVTKRPGIPAVVAVNHNLDRWLVAAD